MRPWSVLIPFAVLALTSPALAAGTIELSGHGEVTASPDSAFVTSGVTTEAATAKAAVAANNHDVAALIMVLKDAGIDPDDIQTSGFSVSPNYVDSNAKDANGYDLPPKIAAYTVSNGVTVHIRDLKTLGPVLDQMVGVGANTIGGITFAVENPTEFYEAARKAAFADAKAKADTYATAAGVSLGTIDTISEGAGYTPRPPVPMMAKAMIADAASVPVEAGQLTYAVDVSVTWDIGPAK